MGFQAGAKAVAKTHGIGLMTLNKEKAWAFGRSQDTGFISYERVYATYSLYTFGLEIEGSSGRDIGTLIDHELRQ